MRPLSIALAVLVVLVAETATSVVSAQVTPCDAPATFEDTFCAEDVTYGFDAGVSQSERVEVHRSVTRVRTFAVENGLPLAGPVEIFTFADKERLVQVSVSLAWTEPIARQFWTPSSCRAVSGSVRGRKYMIVSAACAGSDSRAVYFHEYFHLIQKQLVEPFETLGVPDSQTPRGGPRWLLEGTADLIRFNVEDAHGLVPYSTSKAERFRVAGSSSTSLETIESWTGMEAAEGGTNAAYALGFAAADLLVATSGLPSLAVFWRTIGADEAWPAAFAVAFGRTVETFYQEFSDYRVRHIPQVRRIRGKVTRGNGTPYPDIHVYACSLSPGGCGQAVTAADGSYSIPRDNGTYVVQFGRTSNGATPDGYYSTNGFVANRASATPVSISGADVPGINVTMSF